MVSQSQMLAGRELQTEVAATECICVCVGEQAGKMLLSVTANDIDIQPMLTYDLLTFTDMFAVDKYSGKMSLTGKLDHETRTSYNLTVMVISWISLC